MMKKLLFLLQLIILLVFSSCQVEDVPIPYPLPSVPVGAENTIFVYMPWSGSPGNLYTFFQKNLTDIKQAVVDQGGLGDKRLMIFISDSPSKGSLINVKYESEACVDDTIAVFDNTLDNQKLNSVDWIADLLRRVQEYAPARSYSMIVGCHGMGWLPGNSETRSRYSLFSIKDKDNERLPLTRWFGGETYKTNISTLDKGIEQSGIGKMQYILFDDCYMSTVEVAYELRHSTNHIISCPTEIMAHGMPYDLLWTELSKSNPDYARVCDTFYNFYSKYDYPYGTISVIDCSQIEAMTNIMREINHSRNLVNVSEDDVQIMDGYQPAIFFDMGDYVRKIAKNETDLLTRFERQLNLLVPYKRNTPSYFTEVRNPGVGAVIPIKTYSGITISDLSSNRKVLNGFAQSPYYKATH